MAWIIADRSSLAMLFINTAEAATMANATKPNVIFFFIAFFFFCLFTVYSMRCVYPFNNG